MILLLRYNLTLLLSIKLNRLNHELIFLEYHENASFYHYYQNESNKKKYDFFHTATPKGSVLRD